MTRARAAVLFLTFLSIAAVPMFGQTATTDFRVLLDVDDDATTGCSVATMPGVEQVLTTRVVTDPTTGNVTRTYRQVCTGGVLGPEIDINTPPWSAGFQPASGNVLVETRLPFSALPSGLTQNMRIGVSATAAAATHTAIFRPDGSMIHFPTPSHGKRRSVTAPGSERVFVLDGNGNDWTAITAIVDGIAASGSQGLRIIKFFAFANVDDDHYYFRFDANLSTDAPFANDDAYSRPQGEGLSVPAPGVLANDGDPNGNPLTAQPVSSPANGSVTLNPDGSFTYTPNDPAATTSDHFEYRASNGTKNSNTAQVRISVATTANIPPVGNDDAYGTPEDELLNIAAPGVLTNDTDANGDPLTATLLTPPSNGTVVLAANGGFTYTPGDNFFGTDTFVYTVSDGTDTDTATVTITVTSENDNPNVAAATFTVDENSANGTIVGTVSVFDNDATDTHTFSIEGGNTNDAFAIDSSTGTITVANSAAINFESQTQYFLIVRATDSGSPSRSDEATITINVVDVNDAPVANNTSATTNEDTGVGITLSATDEDGDTLTYNVNNPSNGVLTGVAPNLTYTPNANFFGTDSFTYTVNDGTTNSNTATVTITVISVNDVPVATADGYTVNEGGTLNESAATGVLANDTDVESALTAVLESGPTNASSFTLNADGSFTYTHDGSETTSDSFTYHANDGTADSNTVTVSITVNPVNDAPVANGDSITTNEDTPVGITLVATDAEGSTLTYNVNNPSNGALSGTAPNLTYTPNADFFGTDSFTYTVNDGTTNSNTAMITITVISVNDVPVANDDAYTVDEGGTLNETAATGVLANDTDVESSLTAVLVSGPANASSFTLNADGSFTYTHNGSDTTSDSFTYVANDGSVDSNTATVTITINPVNDPPVNAVPAAQATNEDTALTFNAGNGNQLSISDADAGTNQVRVTLSVTNGTLTLGSVTNLSFGTGDGTADTTMTFDGAITDINNALNGLTYDPTPDHNGAAVLTITTDDLGNSGGAAETDTDTVNITVNAINDAPVAADDAYTVAEGGTINVSAAAGVLANDSDVEGSITAVLVSGPSNDAAFTLNADGSFDYTHDGSETTSDSFTYMANDGTDNSSTVTVTITITPVNDAPVAVGDSASVDEGGTLNGTSVLANDNDAEGDTLTAFLDAGPSNAATFTFNGDGTYTYIHNGSETTSDSFTYHANDTGLDSNTVTVNITINPINDAPTAAGDAYSVNEGATLNGTTVLANDSDPDSSMSAVLDAGPSNAAAFTLNADGTFTYTHNGSETTSDSFTYHAFDGSLSSATVTVNITINPVNDAPINGVPGAQSLDEDLPLIFSSGNGNAITVSDAEAITLEVKLTATNGTLTLGGTVGLTFTDGDGTDDATMTFMGTFADINNALQGLSFKPTVDYNGAASVTIDTSDLGVGPSGVMTDSDTINITINAVNDAPDVTVPGAQSVNEDTPLVINAGVTDIDAGGGTAELQIGCSACGITLASTAGLNITTGDGTNDSSIVATGTIANINAAINGFTYQGAPNASGADTITIIVSDFGNTGSGGAQTDTETIAVTVNAVNDAPVAVADSGYTVDEGATLTGASTVLGNDTDVEFDTLNAVLDSGPTYASSFTLYANGTFDYTHDGSETTSDSFTYHANDGTANSNTVTVAITINPVNDAPVVTVPGAQVVNEDTPLVVTAGVTDADAGSGTASLDISCNNCGITLASTTGLTFTTGDGTDDASMVATGTIANIDAAINGFTYQGIPNYAGSDTITITVNDGGNTGSGGAQSDTETISVTVNDVNDAPVNSMPAADETTDEDVNVTISPAISISDIDAGAGTMAVTLTSTNGTMTVADTTGLTVTSVDATDESTISFTGTIAAINNALTTLSFNPTANFFGTGTITILTDDQGNTGGGSQTDTDAMNIIVSPVNDAPSFTKGPDIVADSNAGAHTSDPWATAIDPGPGEGTQNVSFEITANDNTGLFTAGPSVSPTGALTFTPVAGVTGVANISVRIKDDGGTSPGVDVSASQSFTISLDDAPFVSSTTPAEAGVVATDSTVSVTFSEDVTLSGTHFEIVCASSGTHDPSNSNVTGGAQTYTFDPNANFTQGESCTMTIFAAQVADNDAIDGPNNMVADHVVSFTVDAQPSVSTITPADLATDQTADTNVDITFSEAVTVSGSSFTINCGVSGAHAFALTGSGASYTLNPGSDFTENETCTVTVLAAQVADQDGVDPPDNMAADFVSTFQIDAAPFVSSTTPVDNATDPQPNTDITITFSEPVDATGSSFTINCTVSGAHTYVLGGNPTTYTLNPNTDFTPGETCTVTVLAAQVDDQDTNDPPANMTADYVFDFSLDKAPEVSSTTPTNGATGVTLDANVDITFDEDVTLTGTWFTINCATSAAHTASVTGGPAAYTLDPDTDFSPDELCTVTVVGAQVTDNDTNDPPDAMLADYVFTFTTDAAPSVTATDPADNATDIGADTNIDITFSESVANTLNWFTINCTVSGGHTAATTGTGASRTLNPDTSFTEGETCTVTLLAAEITDSDTNDPPNNMLADYVFDFTIDEAPDVTDVTPDDNATNIATDASVDVVFSESVTFSGTSSTINCATSGAHAFAVTGSGTSWTLNPNSDFAQNELCTVTIVATDVADSDANDPPDTLNADFVFDFTTDLEPSVTATTPADTSTTFPATDIDITFSEAVDVTGSWFSINCDVSGSHSAAVTGGSVTYTLNPDTDFTGGEVCTVTVLAAQVDDQDAGDPPANLAANYEFSFSVDAAPTVLSTTPADNDTDIAADTDVTVNFSEMVNVTASAFTINCTTSGGHTYTTGANPNSTFVLNPNSNFSSGETCTVTVVAAEVTDDDANDPPDNLATDYVFSFSIDEAPAVFSTTPADNATDISAGTNVDITFTEPVTVAGTSFTINCTTSGAHTFGLSGTGASYTLDPTANFTAAETCTVTVLAAGVADDDTNDPPNNMLADYVFDFTIDVAPSVSSTTPADNDTDIAANTDITLNFSESVALGGSPVTISCTVSGAHPYVVAPLTSATTFTVNPDSDFTQGETCTVTVLAAQVADDDGNDPPDNMLADYVFDFTIDLAPFVSSTNPADNATNGAPGQDLTITFSEPVNVTGTWFDINCTVSGAHSAVVSGGLTTYSLNPDTDFTGGETCTVQIFAANVTDDDTNDPPDTMTADYVFDFIIDEPPVVNSTSPVDNATNQPTNTVITINYSEAVHATGTAYTVSCGAFTLGGNDTAIHTLTPTTAWTQGAICNVTITASEINDTDPNDPPNLMENNYAFSFTTDAQPSVVTTTPLDNATGVTTNADVVIQFSEPVNITANAITVNCATSGSHTYTITANPATTFTLNPNVDFTQGELCTVTVPSANVSDDDANDPPNNLAGNYVFDFTIDAQPSVVTTTPLDNATNITSDANVVIQFSEPVNIGTNGITVVGATSGSHTYAITANPATTFTLNPSVDFAPGEVVTVTVPAAQVADNDPSDPPDNLAADYVFDFTIDAQPNVTTTVPVDETIDVAKTTNITINFSENVDTSGSSFTIKCPAAGSAIGFAFVGASVNTNTVTLNPTSDLPDGERCEVTVIAAQVNDTDTNDPPANLPADFTFQFGVEPNADDDTHPHTHVGNVNSNSDGFLSVVTNDDFPVAFPITSMTFDATTVNGGQIVMNTNPGDPANFGEFTYNPPPGFEGTDTFTYTINTANGSDTATVSIPVSGMVWFIDASDVTGPFDGRIASPFSTLAQFEAVNGNVDAGNNRNPQAGDNIFLYQSGTAYTGPVTLENTQKVIGQDSATAAFGAGSITNLTAAPSQSALPGVNSGDGVFVNITSAGVGFTAAQNNQIRGLRFGNNTGGAIVSTNIGNAPGLLIRDALINNGTGGGVDVQTGTIDAIFASYTTSAGARGARLNGVGGTLTMGTGTISGYTTVGIDITGQNPTVSFSGTVSNTSGRTALMTSNLTGGSITLGTVNLSGAQNNNDGIVLDGSAAIPAVDLTITSYTDTHTGTGDDGIVLSDLGSGSDVTVTGGSITTGAAGRRLINFTGATNCNCNFSGVTFNGSSSDGLALGATQLGTYQFGATTINTPNGGIAVSVIGDVNAANTDSSVTFASVNVATCSQAGIYVHSHSGSFTSNGGTISSCADWGARFGQPTSANTGAKNITLSGMTFTSNGTANNDAVALCGFAFNGTNTNCAANIDLQNVATASLSNIVATGSAQIGINGKTVSGLTLTNVEAANNGNETNEDGVQFADLTGTMTWSGINFHDNFSRQLEIQNSTGTVNLTINGTSPNHPRFTNAVFQPAASGQQGILFSGHGTANITMNLQNAEITRTFSSGYHTDIADTATANVTVNNATLTDVGSTFNIAGVGSGNFTYAITNSTMYQTYQNSNASGLIVQQGEPQSGTFTGTITGNTIGDPNIAGSSAPCDSCNAISIRSIGRTGTHNVTISGNTIQRTFNGGIYVFSGKNVGNDSGNTKVKILTNIIRNPDDPSLFIGGADATVDQRPIHVENAALAADTTTTCADILNNTISDTAGTGTWDVANLIRIAHRNAQAYSLPNYGGAANGGGAGIPQVVSYINGRNNYSGLVGATASGTGGIAGGTFTNPGANCF